MPTNQVAVPDPNTGLMTSGLDADTLRKALAIAEAKGDSTAMELLKRLGQQSSKQYAGGRVVPVDVTGLNQGIANVAAAFVGGQEQKAEQDELNRTAQAKADWLAEKPTPDQGTAAMEQWLTRGEQSNLRSTLQELIYGKKVAADAALDKQAAGNAAAMDRATLGANAAMDRTMAGIDAQQTKAAAAANAPPKTTESERSSAGYLSRMRAAESTLNELEQKYPDGAAYPNEAYSLLGTIPGVGDYAQAKLGSDAQNLYKQQTEDWIRAKLRKESGAVIGDEEMAREYATFFPKAGDSEKVREQKRLSRKQAEKAFEFSAGAADKPTAASATPKDTRQNAKGQTADDIARELLQQGQTPDQVADLMIRNGMPAENKAEVVRYLNSMAAELPVSAPQATPAQATATAAPSSVGGTVALAAAAPKAPVRYPSDPAKQSAWEQYWAANPTLWGDTP